MSDDEVEIADAEERELAERLSAEQPRPSPALRRRVRDRVAVAFRRRAMRCRSVGLVASGTALLAVSLVLALSVPS